MLAENHKRRGWRRLTSEWDEARLSSEMLVSLLCCIHSPLTPFSLFCLPRHCTRSHMSFGQER